MSVRGFYQTKDGDELPVDFDYDEEKRAFDNAIRKLESFVPSMHNMATAMAGVGNPPVADKKREMMGAEGVTIQAAAQGYISVSHSLKRGMRPILTTLQAEQCSRLQHVACRILGVDVFNVHSRSGWNIALYTNYKWEEDKWVTRT